METGTAPVVYPAGGSCVSNSTTSSCTAPWSADVTGWYYGTTTGTWKLQQLQCTSGDSTCSTWKTIANGGAGPFAAAPGSLPSGSIYELVISGVGYGSIGSYTGTGPA